LPAAAFQAAQFILPPTLACVIVASAQPSHCALGAVNSVRRPEFYQCQRYCHW